MTDRKTAIIFHPKDVPFDRCAVDLMDELLKFNSDESFIVLRPKDGQNSLADLLTNDNVDRTIVFTHGRAGHNQFITKIPGINHEWWRLTPPMNKIFAHACFSAQVLSSAEWKDVFNDWVGATKELAFSTDQESQAIWKEFYERIIKEFNESDSSEQFVKRFNEISMHYVAKCIGRPGLTLFKSLIVENTNRITCKTLYN